LKFNVLVNIIISTLFFIGITIFVNGFIEDA